MFIKGANTAVTRENGQTIIDAMELLECMTRRERIALAKMIDFFNEEEKRAGVKPRPPQR